MKLAMLMGPTALITSAILVIDREPAMMSFIVHRSSKATYVVPRQVVEAGGIVS